MIDPRTLAANVLNNNPSLANDPANRPIIDAIRNNDAKAGVALANQILQKAGISREQALEIAKQRFNMR